VDSGLSISEELVEELDALGRPVRVVTRAEMRAGNLRHRAVYVLVLDAAGRLLAHRRADWKDVWPGRWDVAFGGVAGVGEPPEEAARRELAEEAGVAAPLQRLGDGRYEDAEVRVRGDVFLARFDGPFTFADGEVVETAWVPVEELAGWLAGRSLCPDSVEIALPLLRRARRAALLERYAAAPDLLAAAIRGLPAAALAFRPEPGAWSIADTVQHLADNEAVDSVRLRMAIAQSGSLIQRYDEGAWARELGYESEDVAEALVVFRVLRARSCRLLGRLPEEAWDRTLRRPEGGERTVEQKVSGDLDHVDLHVGQIAGARAAWEAANPGRR
jgi:isopentenyldiphosphate isomerase